VTTLPRRFNRVKNVTIDTAARLMHHRGAHETMTIPNARASRRRETRTPVAVRLHRGFEAVHYVHRSLTLRNLLVKLITFVYIGGLYILIPVLPVVASLIFLKKKYVLEYTATLKKLKIHIDALREGSVAYYFSSLFNLVTEPAVEIAGNCIRCGECCMNKRCVFLEQIGEKEYQCGVYHSPLRKFSNCGAYPVSQRDIDRYACPSYYVIQQIPIKVVFEPNATRS
jgi:hypothetical protein